MEEASQVSFKGNFQRQFVCEIYRASERSHFENDALLTKFCIQFERSDRNCRVINGIKK